MWIIVPSVSFSSQKSLQGFNIARMYYEVGEMEKALKSVEGHVSLVCLTVLHHQISEQVHQCSG